MNKYDYVTMTIEEEKKRLEKIIPYLELENNVVSVPEIFFTRYTLWSEELYVRI